MYGGGGYSGLGSSYSGLGSTSGYSGSYGMNSRGLSSPYGILYVTQAIIKQAEILINKTILNNSKINRYSSNGTR